VFEYIEGSILSQKDSLDSIGLETIKAKKAAEWSIREIRAKSSYFLPKIMKHRSPARFSLRRKASR